MVDRHNQEGFGGCTVIGACAEACPKGLKLDFIARMNKDYLAGSLTFREEAAASGSG